ncbi:1-deoxy-D-xylulose-5-phosphate reductoisomerase [Candidatus Oleimmundimicrobium sp.]|uniref:1-deoxy-D-xylulose-5-phosphate reductoisomerase n=1 Tax=Candidatus Oleimmundimicrobium sp. TaxID=3060597 RepID=UPI00272699C1|nr:1-deoxy-D-xylulose-5-phosphate reductoisomerase [Candidatus Oleimmundimicrobium sp.]MDO8885457.1 1-deoxy-D-xylulose-5-phosphate reductoisomerase [Candidatus Oleimmundimicrobium sp.]
MKKIIILGSTGSIGRQTLDVVRQHRDIFQVVGLSAYRNIELLIEQVNEFNPQAIAMPDFKMVQVLRDSLIKDIKIFCGEKGLAELALFDADIVLNALVGSAGLEATVEVVKSGKTLALANKESMVIGGEIINRLLPKTGAKIIPVDSEHSAIYQCLIGEKTDEINKIILTASGGPFRGKKLSELQNITPKEALAHPRWNMGKKISIDSATLMNKGLEVIEAHFLFNLDYDKIETLIHPQSIIHSMVEFIDGSIKAHLGPTDMRIPIQYALSYPKRIASPVSMLNFIKIGQFTFEEPDLTNFPCLKYAIESGEKGGTFPAVLNAANEEAVAAFLNEELPFLSISKVIYTVLSEHKAVKPVELNLLKEVDNWARIRAREVIKRERG